MNIIVRNANDHGSRPPLQTWSETYVPEGYAWCPDEFTDIFYSTNPAGFVNIEIENDTVVVMTVNKEAYDAYVATHPTTDPKTDESDISVADMATAIREGVNEV